MNIPLDKYLEHLPAPDMVCAWGGRCMRAKLRPCAEASAFNFTFCGSTLARSTGQGSDAFPLAPPPPHHTQYPQSPTQLPDP